MLQRGRQEAGPAAFWVGFFFLPLEALEEFGCLCWTVVGLRVEQLILVVSDYTGGDLENRQDLKWSFFL